MVTTETDVLIVGAGPAGATAAALLSTYGIANMMVNKYPGVANSPRAHIVNQRTMEVLRDLGLEDQAKAWAMPQDVIGTTVWATDLAGKEFGRLQTWYSHPYRRRWTCGRDCRSPAVHIWHREHDGQQVSRCCE
ncbi:FAD-dependent monooxygenase [Rhodococcus opacus]